MTRTLSIKIGVIGATLITLGALLAYGSIAAYAASSLFGGASMGGGYVTLVSDADVNPANDYSGVTFDDASGVPFTSLAVLSADFDVTDDSCGGGSPRFQIQVDTTGDSVSDGNVFVAFGPSPSFSGCTTGWQSTGNVIGNTDAGRFDYGQFGGSSFTTYAGAPASVLAGTVLNISIVVDGSWSSAATGGDGEQTVLIDNVQISILQTTVYPFNPPPPVTVTIVKYVDGVHATAGTADSAAFPMSATWNATNIGAGSGSFSLSTVGFNNPNPYEATTASMTSGADYSTNEVTGGAVVGANCAEGKPFALVGYTTGDTESAAAGETPTLTIPSFTGLTTDKVVIVWNEKCVTTLTLQKTVINDDTGTALDTDWTLSASGPTPVSGVEGNASVTNAVVTAGTYDLSESGPSGYTASSWICTGGTQNDADTITLAAGESATCVITNDDTIAAPPAPSPPANACATPLVAPVGYTLVNGLPGSDIITLLPNTMFVGNGGNDQVSAPDGNYIICTGNGNETITIGNGDFTIDASNGNNKITTGNGAGTIITAQANDTITTGDGVQTITAGNGNNIIVTGDGDKTVTTGNANDKITTGGGADVINAGGGINTVKSGAGNDSVTTGSSIDNIDGGADTDTCAAGGGLNTVVNCEA